MPYIGTFDLDHEMDTLMGVSRNAFIIAIFGDKQGMLSSLNPGHCANDPRSTPGCCAARDPLRSPFKISQR
jgi:hypothetical protein